LLNDSDNLDSVNILVVLRSVSAIGVLIIFPSAPWTVANRCTSFASAQMIQVDANCGILISDLSHGDASRVRMSCSSDGREHVREVLADTAF
jgi:hypothetical protein